MLEINQAGLSWLTDPEEARAFRAPIAASTSTGWRAIGESDAARLLADAGIIRNRLKVDAAIENAKRIQALQKSHGSLRRLARRRITR